MSSLTIVILYFKRTFFEATLESLAEQTAKRFQVYIGDDASSEDCSNLTATFSKFIMIKYIHFETSKGGTNLVGQWERCPALVKKESWVQVLGDDDVVSENFIASFDNSIPDLKKYHYNVFRFASYVADVKGLCISKQFTYPILKTAPQFFERKFAKKTRSSLSE